MMIELGVPCSEIELTGEAMEAIGDFYAELRSRSEESALPVTVRTLETVIRLSTAAAKARLSKGAAHLDTDERALSDVSDYVTVAACLLTRKSDVPHLPYKRMACRADASLQYILHAVAQS